MKKMVKNLSEYGDVLSVNDLYDLLPLGMNNVRKLVVNGDIKSKRAGKKKYIILKADLIKWLES